MKTLSFTLAALLALSTLSAEEPGNRSDRRPGPPDAEHRMSGKDRFLKNLPPEARERFKAAREKALQDPQVADLRAKAETANHEFFAAMRKKMMEIDPGLEEIVKNARGPGKDGKDRGDREDRKDRRDRHREGDRGGFGKLDEVEKTKLMAAREKAKADPVVQAAEKAKKEAATPEDRKAAADAYRNAMHTTLLKVDPTLGPILEKLAAPPPPAPGGDGMMQEN